MFKTIKESVSSEIVEKKSKFIANLFYVESKEEAENIIKKMKKKYHDARHNCVAYRVMENETIIEKSSDDGEPSGTAGAPMLDIIRKADLCNVLVIVTRYFGGILLGTGGLVRCYSGATIKAIENSKQVCRCLGYEMEVELDYNNLDIFKYHCKNNDIFIVDINYLDVVVCKIQLEEKDKEKLEKDIDTKEINIKNIRNLCKKYINKSVEN